MVIGSWPVALFNGATVSPVSTSEIATIRRPRNRAISGCGPWAVGVALCSKGFQLRSSGVVSQRIPEGTKERPLSSTPGPMADEKQAIVRVPHDRGPSGSPDIVSGFRVGQRL